MIEKEDIPTYFRDLYYTTERILDNLKTAPLSKSHKDKIRDNVVKKQVIITRIIALYLNKD